MTIRLPAALMGLLVVASCGSGPTSESTPGVTLSREAGDSVGAEVSIPSTTTLPPEATAPVLPAGPIEPTSDSVAEYVALDPVDVMTNRVTVVDAATAFCFSMREMALWSISETFESAPSAEDDNEVVAEFVEAAREAGVATTLQEAARRATRALSEVSPPDSGAEFYAALMTQVREIAKSDGAGPSEYEDLLREIETWNGAEEFGVLVEQIGPDCYSP